VLGHHLFSFLFPLLLSLGPAACSLALGDLPADPLDFAIAGGHFYKQANGQGGTGDTGYSVANDTSTPLWDEFQRLGGVEALGYPASRRFLWGGFVSQAMGR